MKSIIMVAIATSLALLFGTVPGALANSGAYLLVPSGSTNNVLRYDRD
jgi:hypothetical protein